MKHRPVTQLTVPDALAASAHGLTEAQWRGLTDAEFIAAAPSDVAFLLDLARKQHATLDAVREVVDSHDGKGNPTIEAYLMTEALEAKP